MAHVYILRDIAGRHYLGANRTLDARLEQHRAGGTQTTRRMTGELTLAASRELPTMQEALALKGRLKGWKNATKAIQFLHREIG